MIDIINSILLSKKYNKNFHIFDKQAREAEIMKLNLPGSHHFFWILTMVIRLYIVGDEIADKVSQMNDLNGLRS